MIGPLVVTLCCEFIRDDWGRVRVVRGYLKSQPEKTLGLWGVTYPEDVDDA